MMLKTQRVQIDMELFTRRINDFGVHAGDVPAVRLSRMPDKSQFMEGVPRQVIQFMRNPILPGPNWSGLGKRG
jgi:hypothetical protein